MSISENDIQLVKAGNEQAFIRLYNDTIKTAYYVAKRLLTDDYAVEDILQESYVVIYEKLGSYNSGNFQGWVDTIVANRCKNYLRKKNPVLFSQMQSEEDPQIDFEDDNIAFRPDEKMDYEETKRLVMNIIDELPDEQRMSVVLFYYEQMSVKEIAKVFECSENTIKSRLNYGRKTIKQEVLKLEKKGTKLYCMPLLPFLLWLFAEDSKACQIPDKIMQNSDKVVQNSDKVLQSSDKVMQVAKTKALVTAKVGAILTTEPFKNRPRSDGSNVDDVGDLFDGECQIYTYQGNLVMIYTTYPTSKCNVWIVSLNGETPTRNEFWTSGGNSDLSYKIAGNSVNIQVIREKKRELTHIQWVKY